MLMFKNGQPCLAIDAQDRAFLYGDGFFTTIKIQDAEALLWPWHVQRLRHCALQLGFDLGIGQIEQQVDELLTNQDQASGILKIIVSRGTGSRGYLPPNQPADVYLQFFANTVQEDLAVLTPHCLQDKAIASGMLKQTLGHVMPRLAGLKTLNRMEQVLLRQELAQTGWTEGLVTDVQGNVIEGVYSNCFFYTNEKWYTPALEQAGIAGVMRAALLDFMQAQHIAHAIQPFPKAGLTQVEAMFFCNAVTGIVPVKSFEQRVLDVQPVLKLAQAVEKTATDNPHWFQQSRLY